MPDLDDLTPIAAAAESADGAAPLDEATWMALRAGTARTWVEEHGFAVLHEGDLGVVVHPDARRRGLGGALVSRALADATGPLTAWSHTGHPAAARLAATYGFTPVRSLWVMRRPASDLPRLDVPEGVTIRAYRPADEADLLRINAAAFATHPEQGAMDTANLAARMAEPWYDPADLLIADHDGAPVAFHWTKRHSAAEGEVYVVGVAPEAQGRGLGKLVTLAGLHHLRERGIERIHLYVESDNDAAVATYSRLGFTHTPTDTHVQYARS